MKKIGACLIFISIICVISCQKDVSEELTDNNNPGQNPDTTSSLFNLNQLLDKTWHDSVPSYPGAYSMSLRFYGDSSLTYSFLTRVNPNTFEPIYDSVLNCRWVFTKPDNISIYQSYPIGGLKLLTLNDSLFTCMLLTTSGIVIFKRVK